MDGLFITDISAFSLILMRMTGFILLNPIFGRNDAPRLFRAGAILSLSMLMYAYTETGTVQITSFPMYVMLMLKELLLGFTIGLVVNMFIYVILLAGENIDMQMGLSMSAAYDPGSNISMSVSGTFYNIMFILVFFTTHSHITLMRIFIESAEVVPYGSVHIGNNVSQHVLELFSQCTLLGIKMSLPVVFLLLITELAVGMMMKAVPQIDVFTINIQLKIMLGLLFMYITFQPMADFMEVMIESLFKGIGDILTVAGG